MRKLFGKRAQKNHLFAEVVSSFNGTVLSSDGSCSVDDLKMFYLAPSYFLRGLPPKYRRR